MYWLHWTAPEGVTAHAELDGVHVDTNEPVECRTWWFASVLAAKIAHNNDSLTEDVARTAERMDNLSAGTRLTVRGWVFWITED